MIQVSEVWPLVPRVESDNVEACAGAQALVLIGKLPHAALRENAAPGRDHQRLAVTTVDYAYE